MFTPPPLRPTIGILWMVAAGLCLVAVTGIVHHLGTAMPAPQAAFLRFAFGLLFLLSALLVVLRAGFPPGTLKLYGYRGAVHTLAPICWFYAVARIPVAEVAAIGYLNPIAVTIGAALIFGERLATRRILAIAVAFLGALVILRPGLREVSSAHLAQLGAAACFAISYLIAKRLSGLAPAGTIVAMMSLTVTIGLLPFAPLGLGAANPGAA